MNSSRRGVVIAGLLLIVLVGLAASFVWARSLKSSVTTGITTGSTSHVHTLVVSRNGSLVLGDQDGLWASKPGGSRWRSFGAPIDHLMPICYAQLKGVMLAGTTGLSSRQFGTPMGLWRSTDRGKHWTRTKLPDKYVTILASNPRMPSTVIAFARPSKLNGAGEGGIWASTDGGITWKRINKALATKAPNGMVLLPGNPFTVLWADSQGIYRSSDGGHTWHFGHLGQAQTLTLALGQLGSRTAFAGTGALGAPGSGVWETTDAGLHWSLEWKAPPTPVIAPTDDAYRQIYGFASAPAPYIYLTSTTAAGKHSAKVEPVPGQKLPLHGQQPAILVSDPTNQGRLYAAYSFPLRLFESTDFGAVWKEIL